MNLNLLVDIELDVQELKYLITAISNNNDKTLCEIARRNISQMRLRLDAIDSEMADLSLINETQNYSEKELENHVKADVIVSDMLRTNLLQFMSLNDSFRFTRELFEGSSEKMNHVINTIDGMSSLSEAIAYLKTEVKLDEENDVMIEFSELLKKTF